MLTHFFLPCVWIFSMIFRYAPYAPMRCNNCHDFFLIKLFIHMLSQGIALLFYKFPAASAGA